jgi:hypothetical protein
MPYQPFRELFPEIADKETRVLTAINDPDLPPDNYILGEAYCNEPDCDCRRVFFNVISIEKQKVVAVIAYGWESPAYYAKWFGGNAPKDVLRDLKGPVLNKLSPQSKLAPALLEDIKVVLQDKAYVERLKRHYQMFRTAVDEKPVTSVSVSKRLSRNAPCPCGSGKKYKMCCGR